MIQIDLLFFWWKPAEGAQGDEQVQQQCWAFSAHGRRGPGRDCKVFIFALVLKISILIYYCCCIKYVPVLECAFLISCPVLKGQAFWIGRVSTFCKVSFLGSTEQPLGKEGFHFNK